MCAIFVSMCSYSDREVRAVFKQAIACHLHDVVVSYAPLLARANRAW